MTTKSSAVKRAAPDEQLRTVRELLEEGELVSDFEPPLVAGVDLGTSNIQMVVLDRNFKPVTAQFKWDDSVRDGIVVDYNGAREVVAGFKQDLEARLGEETKLDYAAVGYPPGTEAWVESNVVEDCQFEILAETPEPTAAAHALEVDSGAIVDVGGGTTGVSIIEAGGVVDSVDEATGGHHLSLVIAGNKDLSFSEAEEFKLSRPFSEYRGIIQPVVEKMTGIVQSALRNYPDVETIYLVGGTVIPDGFEEIFEQNLDREVVKPAEPILVTPLGIACSSVHQLRDS